MSRWRDLITSANAKQVEESDILTLHYVSVLHQYASMDKKNDNNKRALFMKTLKLTHAIMLFLFVDLKEMLKLSFVLKKIKFRAAMRAAIKLYLMTSHHPFLN